MIRVKNSGIMRGEGQVVGVRKRRGACIQDFCGKTGVKETTWKT
jgi:hypothetical protein